MFSQLTRYASQLDVPIEDAELDIRMSYDTRGKLQLADISPAAQGVSYVLNIKSPAPAEKIREVARLIEKGCHTVNTIRNPVPVSGKVVYEGQEFEVIS